MRGRYCVELDLDEMLYTVHRQSCMNFPLAELIPHNLVLDLGPHDDSGGALREARRTFAPPWNASSCSCLFNEPLTRRRADIGRRYDYPGRYREERLHE